MTKTKVAIVFALGSMVAILSMGCSSGEPPSADTGKPAPAVGSTTPGGGVISVESQHGKRPHMGGGPASK